MLFLELCFFLLLLLLLLRLLFASLRSRLNLKYLVIAGVIILIASLIVNGLRWQLAPSSIAFGFFILGLFAKTPARVHWRVLAAIPLLSLIFLSIFLTSQFPLIDLPEPEGQYSVGTFDYSITDSSRAERYDPTRNRELYIEVWYPVDEENTLGLRRKTLWEELYSGEFDLVSFFTHYLSKIETHSYIDAPISREREFPVIVFNHGLYMFTAQNIQLMEHIASHGYVVLSIGHPFESLKVNLDTAGTVLLRFGQAPDIDIPAGLTADGFSDGLASLVGTPVSLRYESLHTILDGFRSLTDEASRNQYVADIIENRHLYNLPQNWQEEFLYSYLIVEMSVPEVNIQTWVDDISYVLDQLNTLSDPIPGFGDSIITDAVGVMGMSFGGAAAGEFCKQDSRCKAGANIDGFQFGENWKSPLLAPFLYVYSHEYRGNSDWAYLASPDKIRIYSIDESNHVDLTELVYSLPILKLIGSSGNVASTSAIEVLKTVHLAFFDQFLKNGPPMEANEISQAGLSRRQLHQ